MWCERTCSTKVSCSSAHLGTVASHGQLLRRRGLGISDECVGEEGGGHCCTCARGWSSLARDFMSSPYRRIAYLPPTESCINLPALFDSLSSTP